MLLNGNRCSQSLKLFKYIHVPISTLTSTFKCYTKHIFEHAYDIISGILGSGD